MEDADKNKENMRNKHCYLIHTPAEYLLLIISSAPQHTWCFSFNISLFPSLPSYLRIFVCLKTWRNRYLVKWDILSSDVPCEAMSVSDGDCAAGSAVSLQVQLHQQDTCEISLSRCICSYSLHFQLQFDEHLCCVIKKLHFMFILWTFPLSHILWSYCSVSGRA